MTMTSPSFNKLHGKQAYRHQVAVYVPSTIDISRHMVNQQWVDLALTRFSQLFGGATAQNAMGAWLSQTVGLVKEDVTIVYAFANALDDLSIDEVVTLAEKIKTDMKQEAVAVSVDGQMYFI